MCLFLIPGMFFLFSLWVTTSTNSFEEEIELCWINGVSGSVIIENVLKNGFCLVCFVCNEIHLPGLAPSDQQVTFLDLCSSSDSVDPGKSRPWWRCFLPLARPSQFLCLILNIRSACHLGSWADQGLVGVLFFVSINLEFKKH